MLFYSIFLINLFYGFIQYICGSEQLSISKYEVSVNAVSVNPLLSSVDSSSLFFQAFNPTYIEPTAATGFKEGLLVRAQNCTYTENKCEFCGGSEAKASVLALAEYDSNTKSFKQINSNTIAYGPFDSTDSWGTEDPRMQYNKLDSLYYMFYTAYNGSSIQLSLATTKNPMNINTNEGWTRHGPVFNNYPNSKSAALLLKSNVYHQYLNTNYLFWGDHDIRVTKSDNLLKWDSIGDILISPRNNSFDSLLVESGPPPLLLSSGDYLFFYNSAMIGWPNEPNTFYNVGYLILSGRDPTKIIQRSDTPLLSPTFAYQQGTNPYPCNVPNVVFLEAAKPIGNNQFEVYFGAADNSIGKATVKVSINY